MNHLKYWLATLQLHGVSSRKFLRWLTSFATIEALFNAPYEKCLAAGLLEKDIEQLMRVNWETIERDMAWATGPSHHIIVFEDDDYPSLLKEISHPPLVLYIKGDKSVLKHKQIAIVGSRHPTPAGLMNAEHFAHALALSGFTITSGLALGIDGASHRGALAARGRTLAVAGTGLHHVYPPSHKSLAEEIISSGGAMLSEFPLSMPPRAMHFPRRNRIIGALSIGTLVVEAALKSGSLITARYALEQGREVFAIPGSIHHPLYRGCHYLIRQGAKLVETVSDVLEELTAWNIPENHLKTHEISQVTMPLKPSHLEIGEAHLLAQIGYEITPLDVIILRSGLTASEVSSMLLGLELTGYIKSVSGGYTRNSAPS